MVRFSIGMRFSFCVVIMTLQARLRVRLRVRLSLQDSIEAREVRKHMPPFDPSRARA